MKNFIIIISALIIYKPAHLIAGEIFTNRVSSDAQWVVYFDNDLFNKSQSGRVFRSEIDKSGDESNLKNLENLISLRPFDDINNITIYGRGKDRKKAITLIQGKIDKSKLQTFIETNTSHKLIQYNGIDIHQWSLPVNDFTNEPNGQIIFGGFYRNDLIVLGSDLSVIEHAFDVLKEPQLSASGDFLKDMAPDNNNSFFQAVVKNISGLLGSDSDTVILKNTNQLSLKIGENQDTFFVNLTLNTDTNEIAESIKKIIEGLIAFLTLENNNMTHTAELVKRIKLSTDDNSVQIDFEMELETIMHLIE